MPRPTRHSKPKEEPPGGGEVKGTTTVTMQNGNGHGHHQNENGVPPGPPTSASGPSSKLKSSSSTPNLQLTCVVCYSPFAYYTLNCSTWEQAVTRDFYVAMNIPHRSAEGQGDGGDEDMLPVTALPFCPECHSKVSVMFSLHQQLLNVLQSFNCIRNDLAFTVVDTIGKNCKKGPLDLIRQNIYDRWEQLYNKAKKINASELIDEDTSFQYLEPSLSVADEFPIDSKMMNLSVNAKQRLTQMRKTPAMIRKETKRWEHDQHQTAVEGDAGMPILEPIGKLKNSPQMAVVKTKSPSSSPPAPKVVVKKVFKKNLVVKPGSKYWSQHFKPNSDYKKKKRRRLANGLYKCSYCPMTYDNDVKVSQHESRAHPQTRPFLCNQCPKGFSTHDGIRKHLMYHHTESVEGHIGKCPYCPRIFSRKAGFEQHIANLHPGKKVPNFDALKRSKNPTAPKAVRKSKGTIVEVKVQRKGQPPANGNIPAKVPPPAISPPSPEITDLEGSPERKKAKTPANPNKRGVKRSLPTSATNKTPLKKGKKGEVQLEEGNTIGDTEGSVIPSGKEKEEAEGGDGNPGDGELDTEKITTQTSKSPAAKRRKSRSQSISSSYQDTAETIFKCGECSKEFKAFQTLQRHRKLHKNEEKEIETNEKGKGVSRVEQTDDNQSMDKNGGGQSSITVSGSAESI